MASSGVPSSVATTLASYVITGDDLLHCVIYHCENGSGFNGAMHTHAKFQACGVIFSPVG
eukprot:3809311-Prorocentrum_lima.AAC.1